MPGLVAIISRKPAEHCESLVSSMLESMRHERFYVSGTCSAPELGIYAGWVAHPNSFAAGHSGAFEDAGVCLVLSGECFEEAASAEPGAGDRRANWLVRRYEQQGEEFVSSLNGLFSGLLLDRRRRRAFLFNDRYGMERLYCHETKGAIYLASEAKALLRVVPELRAFDHAGVAQFLAFGCTLGQQTLFQGVSLLPGGSRWRLGPDQAAQKATYFQPKSWEAQPVLGPEDFEREFLSTFQRVLPRYLAAAEGLGISLTGGLDTRMIMACLPPGRPATTSYTFAGLAGETLDVRLAAQIAGVCGLKHTILRPGTDFLARFSHYLDRTVFITDGCAGALGTHEIAYNAPARQLAPVRLTGNFGSEIFRSVSTFKAQHLAKELLREEVRRQAENAVEQARPRNEHPVTAAAFREVPWNLFGTLAAARSQITFRTPYLDNALVALAYRTPSHLRASPRPALRFVMRAHPALARIPTDRGQVGDSRGPIWALRRLFAEVTFKLDYLHKEGLPGAWAPLDPVLDSFSVTGLLGLHKFLPYRRWFQRELSDTVMNVLTDARTRSMPWWNHTFLESMGADHLRGRNNYVREIGAVLTLEAVQRLLLQTGEANPPAAAASSQAVACGAPASSATRAG